MSLASYTRRQEDAKDFLAEVLDLIEVTPTSMNDLSLNLELLKEDLQSFVDGVRFKPYLFPLNQLEGPQLDFPRLISYMKTNTVEDYEKILSRFRQFPQQIEESIHLLEEGMRIGITMHSISASPLPKQLLEQTNVTVEKSGLFKPFLKKPDQISDVKWCSLVDNAKDLISNTIMPTYEILAKFIKDVYLKSTRQDIGVSSLPNGSEFYAKCLRFHTTTDLTPQEVHDMGKKEVTRINHVMESIREKVGFEGTLPEFRAHMRTDPKLKFKNASEILDHYNKVCEKIAKILPKYFLRVPESRFVITPVPEEVAPNFPGAYYLAPPQDKSRPGTFFINTYLPETRNKYEAVCLSLHEAEPGHHLQAALTMESESLVDFRRFMEDRKYYEPPARFAMNTAYTEGWGLYSEYLGEEMGLYADPYDMFGRLSHEMLRACRLVVDTGMHALGWSRGDAIQFMLDNTATSQHDIESEIDRYITWPGQACGYKVGELKIKEIRKNAEDTLGEKFDIRKFHDLIASMGGVPIKILENQINKFVENNK